MEKMVTCCPEPIPDLIGFFSLNRSNFFPISLKFDQLLRSVLPIGAILYSFCSFAKLYLCLVIGNELFTYMLEQVVFLFKELFTGSFKAFPNTIVEFCRN